MRVVKQPGEKWLVLLRQGGGDLDIAEKDDAVFDSEEGLIVYHNDKGRTVTFAPKEGIGWIRSYHPTGHGGFSNMRGQDEVRGAQGRGSGIIPAEVVRELQRVEEEDPEAVYPCPSCHHANVIHRGGPCAICGCTEDP